MKEITVFTGDIQGLVTGGGRLFSCGADGSIRSWTIGKKGELMEAAMREKAHKGRISCVLYRSVRLPHSVQKAQKISQSLVEMSYHYTPEDLLLSCILVQFS